MAKKVEVRNVKNGTIVRFQGDWGVLEESQYFDRWIGGPIRLRRDDMVEILANPKPTRGGRKK